MEVFQKNIHFCTDGHPLQTAQFWPNFTMLTKFHDFLQISQFWPNFKILTTFHNFNKISKISTKFNNFDKISQFWLNLTIFTKFNNFDKISQCLSNLSILIEYHNFNKILQFWPKITILTKNHYLYQKSLFVPKITIFTKKSQFLPQKKYNFDSKSCNFYIFLCMMFKHSMIFLLLWSICLVCFGFSGMGKSLQAALKSFPLYFHSLIYAYLQNFHQQNFQHQNSHEILFLLVSLMVSHHQWYLCLLLIQYLWNSSKMTVDKYWNSHAQSRKM